MIGYVMVGTNDLTSAASFYEVLMPKIGMMAAEFTPDYVGFAPQVLPQNISFYVTKPSNGEHASFGNGTMIALAVDSIENVSECHKTAIDLGGKNAGEPGFRPANGDVFYAYARDLDGNKLCFFHDSTKKLN